jgi:hypothetical protein
MLKKNPMFLSQEGFPCVLGYGGVFRHLQWVVVSLLRKVKENFLARNLLRFKNMPSGCYALIISNPVGVRA